MLKKDKKKVLGEVFDETRVRSFLTIAGREGFDADFLRLERAYRSMNIDNFVSFLQYFAEAGYNINASNPEGQTLLELVQQHEQSGDYAQALRKAGAKV